MTSERTALVTGGARGLGRCIAEHLADSGWKVIATYNTGLDEAKELSRTHGVEIRQVDLTDRSRSLDFARQIRDEFSFDALVKNAGILEKTAFEEFPFDAWDRTLEVNVTAPLILAFRTGPPEPGDALGCRGAWCHHHRSRSSACAGLQSVQRAFAGRDSSAGGQATS